MWWRRILYGSALIGVFVFYLFNGQWLSWILFLTVLLLPGLGFLLSLPSMLLTKVTLDCPEQVPINTGVSVKLISQSPLPIPPIHWRFRAHEIFSDKYLVFNGNSSFLADHCGGIQVALKNAFIYDCLGLFRLPIGRKLSRTILVLPAPLPVKNLPGLQKYLAATWKPKPGGGFAENYDLREYVPGDDLRQIHWKLAAKTGKIILREPTIPIRGKLVLSMILKGTPEDLDRKFGRLLYLGSYFLEKDLPFEIRCGSGEGCRCLSVKTSEDLSQALSLLLTLPLTEEDTLSVADASWHYRIGGEADEA